MVKFNASQNGDRLYLDKKFKQLENKLMNSIAQISVSNNQHLARLLLDCLPWDMSWQGEDDFMKKHGLDYFSDDDIEKMEKEAERLSKEYRQLIKQDKGKPRLSLVPSQINFDIAAVREYGDVKYGDSESWRQVEPERYIDAMLRHALAFKDNPVGLDEESGLPHLWHLATNASFLCELLKEALRRAISDGNR